MKQQPKKYNESAGLKIPNFKFNNEKIILSYLADYYRTMDEHYLEEAFQLAKDDKIDMQQMFLIARSRLN